MENPFDGPTDRVAASIAAFVKKGSAESLLRSALDRGDPHTVERVVLAAAHAFACASPARAAHLFADLVTSHVARSLPRPRSEYLVVGAAAGRCLRALGALRGSSSAIVGVCRAAWAACFGDSLVHALVLARVIDDHDVLILGETGTGKEAVAHAIQEGCLGPKDGSPAPHASLNAAAVPDTLVAAELFGHVKGAFTGANDTRLGRIRTAHGGSLFLDEVGDLGVSTQVKLLRVMETNELSPLGSDRTYRASCRYISATHKDLASMVEAGHFRRDLHQRLAGTVIRLPPLRDRPEDIPAIGRAFVDRYLPASSLDETRKRIDTWLTSREARRHAWPGNVRELQNALRNLLLGLEPGVTPAAGSHEAQAREALPAEMRDATATLDDVVDWYVAHVLARSADNVAHAARILGVDRSTVRRRTRAYASS
ncbi:MAG: sigma 54-interacting transcriptional regulator [Labilithrix sp.]|nr:sigma 54-interacting transcriptional regulator [Labilithrix sp.]MCW5812511.1 sigma 54-interacting transcriptional regulator [Labilithrix sp.]